MGKYFGTDGFRGEAGYHRRGQAPEIFHKENLKVL